MRLAGAAKDAPTRMTCKDLGEKGAAENAHVLLTDFVLTSDIVYKTKRTASSTAKWTKVWVPAVPSDSPYAKAIAAAGADVSSVPFPRPVRVIVVSDDTMNEAQLAALGARSSSTAWSRT